MDIGVYTVLHDDGLEVIFEELKDAQNSLRESEQVGSIYYVSFTETDRELIEEVI